MTDSVSSTTSSTTTARTSYSQNRNDFDSDSLVEAAVSAKLARADTLVTRVTANETKITAYQNLQTLMLTMQDSLQALRSEPGSTGSKDDVFKNRTGYLSSSTSTSADAIMGVTVEDGTAIGTHEIEVLRVAKAERLGGGSTPSRTADLGWSGTFTLGSTLDGTASSAIITVSADMSLGEIVDTINAETTATGVKASVIKVADNDYMIVLTGSQTAATITLAANTGDNVLKGLGLIDTGGNKASILQEAQTAMLTVDGVTVTRNGNDIDDLLDGITLNLYRANVGNTLTLEIDSNLSDVKEKIQELVNSYNALRDFILTNQSTSTSGTAKDDAVLFGDAMLRSITHEMQNALSSSVNSVSLADLGIRFDMNNYLILDEDALDNALLNDLDLIQELLSFSYQSSSGSLALLRHGDGPASASFTIDITVDSFGAISGASVNGDITAFTVSGSRLIGAKGTDYAGLVLVFTGKSTQSVDVSLSQGIADRMWQAVEAVADTHDGRLTDVIKDLQNANSDLEERIVTIENNAAEYRNYLLNMYARIEAKLAKAQAVLDLLEALANANRK